MASKKNSTGAIVASGVEIPIAGVPRRMVFTNGALRAIEEQTGRTLYQLAQDPDRLGGATLTAVVTAGINAAARQDGTEQVTTQDVDDGLEVADFDRVLSVIAEGVGRALGVNIPNALSALRAMFASAVDAIAGTLTDTALTGGADGSTLDSPPESTGG